MTVAQDQTEGPWTKVDALRRQVAALEGALQTEAARRKMAENRLATLFRPSVPKQVAWEAYADVEGVMHRLQTEPRQGTNAWRRWINRNVEREWHEVFSYCHDMAREGRRSGGDLARG